MKHFVLVHGICHGAWCWYKVVNLLKLAGQRATALDLGASGIHSKRLEDVPCISDYVEPLIDWLASLPNDEKVVLVGHSYGGLVISLAMERFPNKISVGVFVTSYMPNCKDPPAIQMGEYFKRASAESFMDCRFTVDGGLDNPPTSVLFGPNYLATKVYPRCNPEDVELAKMLVRPSGLYLKDMGKENLLTQGKYGSVSRVYVVCEEDEIMEEGFQKYVIENSPPQEVRSIPGAGHIVQLSKPKELCQCLQEIADKYTT